MAKLYNAKYNPSGVPKLHGDAAVTEKTHISLSPESGVETFATAQELADFLRLPGGAKFAPFCVDVYANELILVEVNENACNLFTDAFVYLAQRKHAQRAIVIPFAMAEECAELLADSAFAHTSDIIHIQMTGRCGSTLLAKAMSASFERVRVVMEPDCYFNLCAIVYEGALGLEAQGRNPSEWCQEKQSEVVPFVKLHSDRPGYSLGRSYWDFVNAWCRICNIFTLHYCTHEVRDTDDKLIVVIKHRYCAILSKNFVILRPSSIKPASNNSLNSTLPQQHFLWNWRKLVPYVESFTRLVYKDSYVNYWLQTALRIDKLAALVYSYSSSFNSRVINWNPRVGCGGGVFQQQQQNNNWMWLFLCLWLNAVDAAYEVQRKDEKFFSFVIEYEDLVRGGERAIREIWQRFGILPLESYRADAVKAVFKKNSQAGTHAKSSRIHEAPQQQQQQLPYSDSDAGGETPPQVEQEAPWFGKSEADCLNWLLREWNKYGPVRSIDFEFPDSERY